jgi:hypothetical protein
MSRGSLHMAVKAPPHALGSPARAYSRASTKGLCAGPCRAGRCACTEPGALRSPLKPSGALQGDLRAGGDTGPQEVLAALAAACARGAGRPLAAWAAAAFRAAGALGLPPGDAAALGPRHCLRLLLMRGPAAAPVRPRARSAQPGARWLRLVRLLPGLRARRAAVRLPALGALLLCWSPEGPACSRRSLSSAIYTIADATLWSPAHRACLMQPALLGSGGARLERGRCLARHPFTPPPQMQGRPRGAQVAIEFALAHQMGADEAARFIADAFLKARRPLAASAWHMVAAPSPRRPRATRPQMVAPRAHASLLCTCLLQASSLVSVPGGSRVGGPARACRAARSKRTARLRCHGLVQDG